MVVKEIHSAKVEILGRLMVSLNKNYNKVFMFKIPDWGLSRDRSLTGTMNGALDNFSSSKSLRNLKSLRSFEKD